MYSNINKRGRSLRGTRCMACRQVRLFDYNVTRVVCSLGLSLLQISGVACCSGLG